MHLRKHVLDHTGYTALTRQHSLRAWVHRINQEYICSEEYTVDNNRRSMILSRAWNLSGLFLLRVLGRTQWFGRRDTVSTVNLT